MPRGRLALLALAAISLAAGLAGGLARLGLGVDAPAAAGWHGALMVGGFLGTVISLERAVALGSPLAYLAPLLSGAALVAILAGFTSFGIALAFLAPGALFAASVAIVRRQLAAHTVLLAVAALAWLAGNVAHATSPALAYPWWFAFLVLTIAAERLELTRLLPRRRGARPLFDAAIALLLAGAFAGHADAVVGAALFGAGAVATAAWLATFDIARRTVRTAGFARYCAVALLAGYAWLAAAGLAWIALPFAPHARDLALHGIGIGFVLAMVFAHAPLIVPVVMRVRMRYLAFFYVPLTLLHLSLLYRVAADGLAARQAGGVANVLAIVAFAATLAYAIRTRDAGARSAAPASPQAS